MRHWNSLIATFAAGAICSVVVTTANAAPNPTALNTIPSRTAISIQSLTPGIRVGTPNEHQSRSGLSIVKLYMVDYALHHGSGSPHDRALAERMIRYSDDHAANSIDAEYPRAITAVAAEYHLTSTRYGTRWSNSYTSTADVATFLRTTLTTDPRSPILAWMASAGHRAADGTPQNWGTALIPGVQGTKWGWSDFGPRQVASASYGPGFVVVAHTDGTAAEENADLAKTVPQLVFQLAGH